MIKTHKTIGKSDSGQYFSNKEAYTAAVISAAKVKKTGMNFVKAVEVEKSKPKQPKQPKKEPKPKKQLTVNQQLLQATAKAANRKMLALEKKGLATPALMGANEWLNKNGNGRVRFSTNPAAMDNVAVRNELAAAQKFINSVTSTETGHKKVIKKRRNTFINVKGIDEKDLDQVFHFLSSKLFKQMVKYLDSDQIVEILKGNISLNWLMNYTDEDDLTDEQKRIINKHFNGKVLDVKDEPVNEEEEPVFNK